MAELPWTTSSVLPLEVPTSVSRKVRCEFQEPAAGAVRCCLRLCCRPKVPTGPPLCCFPRAKSFDVRAQTSFVLYLANSFTTLPAPVLNYYGFLSLLRHHKNISAGFVNCYSLLLIVNCRDLVGRQTHVKKMKIHNFILSLTVLLVGICGICAVDDLSNLSHGMNSGFSLNEENPTRESHRPRGILGRRRFSDTQDESEMSDVEERTAKKRRLPQEETLVDTLIDSLTSGDRVTARAIVEKMETLNVLGSQGLTPLHVASFLPNGCDAINFLIEQGADIDFPSHDGERPIHHAIRGLPFRVQKTSMLYNIETDNIGCLLARKPTLTNFNSRGFTTLMTAVELVMSVIEESQQANIIFQLVDRLVQGGSSIEELFRLPPQRQEQLLRMCILWGMQPLAQYFLSHASSEYVSSLRFSSTEWLTILSQEGAGILRSLLESGYPVNWAPEMPSAGVFGGEDCISHTLLQRAIFAANVEAVNLLIEVGADTSARDVLGHTPLMLAAGAEYGTVMRIDDYDTPKKLAEIAQALIRSGAEVNAQNVNGETALIIAYQHRLLPVMMVLLEAGADMSIKNSFGEYISVVDGVFSLNNILS